MSSWMTNYQKSNAHIIASNMSQEVMKHTVILPGRTIIFT